MKNLLILSLLLPLFLACKGNEKPQGPEGPAPDAPSKPVVYVTNYPLYYFADRIGGTDIDLRFPASGTADPTHWMPSAEDVTDMQRADLILLNGATYESWLMNVSLPDSLLADTSIGFASNLLPSGTSFKHSHGEEGEHSHEGVASTTWLDLSLAAQQAEAVGRALIRRAPGSAARFEANTEALAGELRSLDREYKALAANGSFPKLAYSKPVFQYLGRGYRLEGPTLGWEADSPLDHDKLHEIGHLRKDPGLQVLVWDRPPLEATVAKLEETGVRSVVINPLESQPETGDFLTGIQGNLEALKSLVPAEN